MLSSTWSSGQVWAWDELYVEALVRRVWLLPWLGWRSVVGVVGASVLVELSSPNGLEAPVLPCGAAAAVLRWRGGR
eukprot:8350127-Prorocentrum_lima.AAC.1